MTPCPHSFVEREEAATVDGRCPLCPRPHFDIDKVAEEIVTVTPNITGERAELWLAGTYRVTASADVEDVLSAAKHIREDIAAFLHRAINGGEK
jgi:hypothetical protein